MNEIVNKSLLAGDTFMPEIHLRQPGFTYIACRPFTKNNERIKKLKKNRRFKIYLSKWNRWSLLSTWYGDFGDFKDFPRRITSDRILPDKAFNIAKNLK